MVRFGGVVVVVVSNVVNYCVVDEIGNLKLVSFDDVVDGNVVVVNAIEKGQFWCCCF